MVKSLLIPGWGQYCNKEYIKAIRYFSIDVMLGLGALIAQKEYMYWERKYKSIDNPYTPKFVFDAIYNKMVWYAVARNSFILCMLFLRLYNAFDIRPPIPQSKSGLYFTPDGFVIYANL